MLHEQQSRVLRVAGPRLANSGNRAVTKWQCCGIERLTMTPTLHASISSTSNATPNSCSSARTSWRCRESQVGTVSGDV